MAAKVKIPTPLRKRWGTRLDFDARPGNPTGTGLWNPTPSAPLRAGSNVEKHDVRMGHPMSYLGWEQIKIKIKGSGRGARSTRPGRRGLASRLFLLDLLRRVPHSIAFFADEWAFNASERLDGT